MLRRFGLTLEKTDERNVISELLAIVLTLVGTFAVTGILLQIANVDPLNAYRSLFTGALGSRDAIVETLARSTPLMLTAISTVIAFRGKIWTIGQEGQLIGGAMMSYWALLLFGGLPRPILLPIIIITGFMGWLLSHQAPLTITEFIPPLAL